MNWRCSFSLGLLVLEACSPSLAAATFTPVPGLILPPSTLPAQTLPAKGMVPWIAPLPSVYPTHTPRAGWPPGKIVFTCQVYYGKQASEQICMIDADDPGAAQSMTYGPQHYYASLAPDGMSMVYSGFREKNVYEIYEEGWREGIPAQSQFRQLTDRLGVLNAPEISPDGMQIAFGRHVAEAGRDEVWVMGRDGRSPHRLTDTAGWDPTWSPDGRQVLFASDLGGSAQLWVVGVDGSGLHQVSNLPAIRGRSDWSPDGKYIVTDSGGSWQHEVYLINADGSNAHQISPPGGNSQGPSFSPDSKWVAFTSYYDDFGDVDGCEIYMMRLDGTDLRRLTDNDYCDYQPRWGP